MDTMILGIAGGTGSGKTTLTRKLCETFGADVSVVYHDNYYKKHTDMTYQERAALNYDHPDAFDTALMVADLNRLAAGEAIRCPVYDYHPQPLGGDGGGAAHQGGDRGGHPHLRGQGPPGSHGRENLRGH